MGSKRYMRGGGETQVSHFCGPMRGAVGETRGSSGGNSLATIGRLYGSSAGGNEMPFLGSARAATTR